MKTTALETMTRIENLLRQRIGLDAASIGSGAIARVVRLRMKNLGLSEMEAYERVVSSSKQEWDELVESLVVTETWFFRDLSPFSAFARLVAENWLPQHSGTTLRILSVPCSSGEEPYSIAMTLTDARVPASRSHIEAVDISARALKSARRGVYGKNAFRGNNLTFRDRHFQKTPEGYTLNSGIRKQVHFYQGNLLSDTFSTRYCSYDFIFCRNLLIYLNDAARKGVLQTIHRLLAPAGYLFVGPAEIPLAVDNGFLSVDIPIVPLCGCVKRTDVGKTSHTSRDERRATCELTPIPPLRDQPNARRAAMTQDTAHPPSSDFGAAGLETARRLADQGKLNEAFALCEDILAECRESKVDSAPGGSGPQPVSTHTAEIYYLMGLLHEAICSMRDERRSLPGPQRDHPASSLDHAMDCYRKALYLNPEHHAALVQSALLARKTGDANAAALRRRLRRLEDRILARADSQPSSAKTHRSGSETS